MRTIVKLLCLLIAASDMNAQLTLDAPIILTGSQSDRAINGLAEPASANSAVSVNAAVVHGGFTWCTVQSWSDTIALVPQPAIVNVQDGLLLRFQAVSELSGNVYVTCGPGIPAIPIRRPDGALPSIGQMETGSICEILYSNGVFTLLNASGINCPEGFLPATSRLCIEVQPATNMFFHPSRDRCAALGGKLCTWSEFVVGCTVLGSQLQGLFTDWEWLDDTSNHAHTTDRAGRLTCASMGNTGGFNTITSNNRCCYHPR